MAWGQRQRGRGSQPSALRVHHCLGAEADGAEGDIAISVRVHHGLEAEAEGAAGETDQERGQQGGGEGGISGRRHKAQGR